MPNDLFRGGSRSCAPSRSGTSGLLDCIAEYLEYQRDEGVEFLDVSDRAMSGLERLASGGASAGPRGCVEDRLRRIEAQVSACRACPLHKTRTRTVPGHGCPEPELLFVGEAPGYDEDRQGLPFVGAAGELLTKMIQAMGFARDQVFIANVIKCRPPSNRTPFPEEMEQCLPFLKEQISLLNPKVIVSLGATPLKAFCGPDSRITRERGNWKEFMGIPVMPTFHPAYLLRKQEAKRDVWNDLQEVLKRLGRQVPRTQAETRGGG